MEVCFVCEGMGWITGVSFVAALTLVALLSMTFPLWLISLINSYTSFLTSIARFTAWISSCTRRYFHRVLQIRLQ